jgi:Domain of unknown function (DUF6265)
MTGLEPVGFLEGRWLAELDGDLLEELWLPAAGSAMLGAFRWLSGGEVKLFELMAITEEEPAPVYRLRHFDADLTAWEERDRPFALPLVAASTDEAAFEGPNPYGETVRFTYVLKSAEQLVCVVARGSESHEFGYERVSGSAL